MIRSNRVAETKPGPGWLGLFLFLPLLGGSLQGTESPGSGITDDLVFAVRKPGKDGHWYANFSYYAADTDRMAYSDGGGKLCRLDPRTGTLTVLLEDGKGRR